MLNQDEDRAQWAGRDRNEGRTPWTGPDEGPTPWTGPDEGQGPWTDQEQAASQGRWTDPEQDEGRAPWTGPDQWTEQARGRTGDGSLLHLLDDEDDRDRLPVPVVGSGEFDDPDPGVPADLAGDPELDIDQDLDRAAGDGYEPVREHADSGDRVEGWVRPEYQDELGTVAGEYWLPVSSYDAGYGWPVPVERLPTVPAFPPAPDSEVPPELAAEPTAPVLQWPPSRPDDRIGPPRPWSAADDAAAHRDDATDGPRPDEAAAGAWPESPRNRGTRVPIRREPPAAPRDEEAEWSSDERRSRRAVVNRRRRAEDPTRALPQVETDRPRPRPRPGAGSAEGRSTVYVSRHAADPS